MMKREHLDLCTNMQRADRVASNAWPSGENRRFRSAGSAGIAARVIVKSMVEGVEMREMSRSIEPKGPFNLPASIGHSDSEPRLSRALYTQRTELSQRTLAAVPRLSIMPASLLVSFSLCADQPTLSEVLEHFKTTFLRLPSTLSN